MPQRTRFPVMCHFRMTKSEHKKLASLTKHYQRSASDVLRRLILDEAERLGAVTQPKES